MIVIENIRNLKRSKKDKTILSRNTNLNKRVISIKRNKKNNK